MSDDKIKISLDDVLNTKVDEEILKEELRKKAGEHYQQKAPPPLPGTPPPVPSSRAWYYNSLIYMSLFGFLGGFFGWLGGEVCDWKSNIKELVGFIELGTIASENRWTDERLIRVIHENNIRNKYFDVILSGLPQYQISLKIEEMKKEDKKRNELWNTLFFMFVGLCIALFISISETVVTWNSRAIIINGVVAIFLGLFSGFLISLFIDDLYRLFTGSGETANMFRQILGRSFAWGIFGALLAVSPGLVLRNFKRLFIGILGGFIGGFLGGALFDPITFVTSNDVISRFVGILAIGIFSGLGTGIIENVAKRGWLFVTQGLIAGKQFILYRNPTVIGSSPNSEIYLFKDPDVAPKHAEISIIPGGFMLEDLGSRTGTFVNGTMIRRQMLKSGDQIQIGRITFEFKEKQRAAA